MQVRNQGWERGRELSVRDIGSAFGTKAAIALLPMEPEAAGLAGDTSSQQVAISLNAPFAAHHHLGVYLAPGCRALRPPFLGIKPLVLISDTSLSSLHSAMGPRWSWPIALRVRRSKGLAPFKSQPGV